MKVNSGKNDFKLRIQQNQTPLSQHTQLLNGPEFEEKMSNMVSEQRSLNVSVDKDLKKNSVLMKMGEPKSEVNQEILMGQLVVSGWETTVRKDPICF